MYMQPFHLLLSAPTRRVRIAFGLSILLCHAVACKSHNPPGYRTAPRLTERDPQAARCLNDKGLASVEKGEFDSAEKHFRGALEHDIYYAPAHNNRGLVLLHLHRYYEAAWEFDCAAKLAPDAAEPRVNLALVYEQTGRFPQAVTEYETALRISPDHAVAMRHLARAYVKAGRDDDQLRNLLEKLLLTPGEPQWDVWARSQIVRLGRTDQGQSLPKATPD
jgi:Tfp pilus assembly protein PilF